MYRIEMRNGISGEENIMVLRGAGRETAQYVRDEFGPYVILDFAKKRTGMKNTRAIFKRSIFIRRLQHPKKKSRFNQSPDRKSEL
ncbi:MAG: hypothetical protein B2I17_04255 [Thermoplasmatales archaeon B_DKE]|nr:MAG: hypothetical protein B2I17_04255 [Thermoplasmatales archaeon B_DKE]